MFPWSSVLQIVLVLLMLFKGLISLKDSVRWRLDDLQEHHCAGLLLGHRSQSCY